MSGVANPAAFPVSTIDGFTEYGMTLLDYFAGQALAGALANPDTKTVQSLAKDGALKTFAGQLYLVAAAMLAEREKHL